MTALVQQRTVAVHKVEKKGWRQLHSASRYFGAMWA